ncbi:Signal transduction histidine kinase [Gracilibacillus ureilyticus]|uniref:histidine kinase n=1 Tax=Gracilibacillus ureilyticus TaxID=531814 RepID=A0A1H9MV23_9BACI|nr:histidine kinase [Gracilibacillus ureilyticus]SER27431.1 Signal transduction histidine kinase [Gracilibacillus ureilyticus]
MRGIFWIWLLFWFLAWMGGLIVELDGNSAYLFGMTAVYFTLLFFTSIVKKSNYIIWSGLIIVLTATFLFPFNGIINPFVWLMLAFLIVHIVYHMREKTLYNLLILIIVSLFSLHIEFFSTMNIFLLCLTSFAIILSAIYYQKNIADIIDLEERYQALLHTYRKLKRDSVSNDAHVRQQERILIGREIHDRVGHTLTNLLMQIEILRLQDNRKEWDQLKSLAKESLSETRKAVKALKEESVAGIAAVIQLIRKLEAEQYISITFSMRQNALSVSLRPEQASVVYRAIQESLTNVMRHSSGKEATITLEAPGATHFRFEVINPLDDEMVITEGFGLKSMRERLKQIGGELEVHSYSSQFVVRGIFPLEGGYGDKDLISRRPGDRKTGN